MKILRTDFGLFLRTFVLGAILLIAGAWAVDSPMFDKDKGVTDEQFDRIYFASIAAIVIGGILLGYWLFRVIGEFSGGGPDEKK